MAASGPLLLALLALLLLQVSGTVRKEYCKEYCKEHCKEYCKEYCIVGAGPSGLQLAYFLQRHQRDYVVLERAGQAGDFFEHYPRHGMLISINKRWADSDNTEYTLRHDWNSLISDNPRLLFRHYSRRLFPDRSVMVRYLNDFQRLNNISVHFNTSVLAVTKPTEAEFVVKTTGGRDYKCGVVVMATGLAKPRPAEFAGGDLTVGYDSVSTNVSDFEGKRVLVIGKGNSGMEVAQWVQGSTRLVHVVGRSPVRLAWSTHYVGDLRAVNNGLLDTYQLKSLDGMFETGSISLAKNAKGELCLQASDSSNLSPNGGRVELKENSQQYCYDIVVRATGFTWDSEPLKQLNVTSVFKGKYPRIAHQFESSDVSNLFFAGTCTHSLDFRQAAGGFVHGFRYTARALHRYLSFRRHREPWPARTAGLHHLLDTLLKRINEGSGTYQMFSFLGDVVLVNKEKTSFKLLEEFPVNLLHILPRITGHKVDGDVFVFIFEYGRNFSGPRLDTFKEGRAGCGVENAYECNFLHPVIYHFTQLPSKAQMFDKQLKEKKLKLPQPKRLLHLMEDFFTSFRQENQVLPLSSFLEAALEQPLAPMSDERCLSLALQHGDVPDSCRMSSLRWSLAEMMPK